MSMEEVEMEGDLVVVEKNLRGFLVLLSVCGLNV